MARPVQETHQVGPWFFCVFRAPASELSGCPISFSATVALRYSLILALAFFCLVKAQALSAYPAQQDNAPHGIIEVHLRLADGSQFSGLGRVRILTQGGPELAENTTDMSGKATIYDLPPGNYIVEASAAGYLAVREDVHLEMRWSLVAIALIMKPDEIGLPKKEGASAAPILAPNARKEVQKGLEAFEKSNLVLARKHFENALAMAPGNPDVQFLMGALEAQEKNFAAADQHLEKAIQIYPNHARSLQLLGELYNQQDRGKDAVPLLGKGRRPSGWLVEIALGSRRRLPENQRAAQSSTASRPRHHSRKRGCRRSAFVRSSGADRSPAIRRCRNVTASIHSG